MNNVMESPAKGNTFAPCIGSGVQLIDINSTIANAASIEQSRNLTSAANAICKNARGQIVIRRLQDIAAAFEMRAR